MYFRKRIPVESGLMSALKLKQEELRKQIVIKPIPLAIETIAGCDSSLVGEDRIFSVFVVFSFPELIELEVKTQIGPLPLPYIPGYLAFREIPNLINTYKQLQIKPDIVMVDGHGIMHPRRMGIATHLGLELGISTFGVAKSKLVGEYENPKNKKGATSPVIFKGEQIGVVLRSRVDVKPIFISPGHLSDLDGAISLTLKTLTKYKLPEPTRIADRYSKTHKPRL